MSNRPAERNRPPGLSITVADQWGYPAPAWKIDVSGWPTIPLTTVPNTPVLQVWWDADGETSPDVRLERGPDFKSVDDLERLTPSIDGQRVTIESVQIEDHEVDIGDGTKQIRSCLVVRLAYPKGLPVCARPYGLGRRGLRAPLLRGGVQVHGAILAGETWSARIVAVAARA